MDGRNNTYTSSVADKVTTISDKVSELIKYVLFLIAAVAIVALSSISVAGYIIEKITSCSG